jgi:hypothetical protein
MTKQEDFSLMIIREETEGGCCTNLIICAAFSFYCISILEKNGMNV